MRGMIPTLALGAVLAAGTATVAMVQGVNNTGYSRDWYNGYPQYSAQYGNPAYPGYYGYGGRYNYNGDNYGYGSSDQRGWGTGGGLPMTEAMAVVIGAADPSNRAPLLARSHLSVLVEKLLRPGLLPATRLSPGASGMVRSGSRPWPGLPSGTWQSVVSETAFHTKCVH